MKTHWILPVVVAALAALGVALLGETVTDLGPWYQSLDKPGWTPPNWAFGLIWTIVFTLTAAAAVSAWRRARNGRTADLVIGLFAANGFLNVLWSLLFFRMQRPDWAFAELLLLWLSIVALIVVCGRLSRLSAVLLLPYLAWVTVAGALNWAVIELNGPFG